MILGNGERVLKIGTREGRIPVFSVDDQTDNHNGDFADVKVGLETCMSLDEEISDGCESCQLSHIDGIRTMTTLREKKETDDVPFEESIDGQVDLCGKDCKKSAMLGSWCMAQNFSVILRTSSDVKL